jgi:hypothetical protein
MPGWMLDSVVRYIRVNLENLVETGLIQHGQY